eukprot:CAMPEP_0184500802 /NCGR_PEP_ID=MMETSP0113_2-20130426/45873_1 /TAXON_ID=91329 /ORGANISM="Norrisiella sphaerica, Strain BC52" /LENGTH=175 /DNA_ID=CAMNT_0026889329 /DNA_START=197 /DNA_END=724 /DNA_ORIENTATION=+
MANILANLLHKGSEVIKSLHLRRKSKKAVTFSETEPEVFYVDHEDTDYGVPRVTAVPGTGSGKWNMRSPWLKNPHTGWFARNENLDQDPPRWWHYENELLDIARNEPNHNRSETRDPDIESSLDGGKDKVKVDENAETAKEEKEKMTTHLFEREDENEREDEKISDLSIASEGEV